MATTSHRSKHVSKRSQEEVVVITKAVKELPPINLRSAEGNEFWGRRKLRPDGHGENFANMPLLKLCICFENSQAKLTVPSINCLNAIVELHNPGGFTFIAISGLAAADELLDTVAHRQFVLSSNKTIDVPGIPDHYLLFVEGKGIDGENYAFKKEPVISTYEHDLVDHIAIAALPRGEVDKLAETAKQIKLINKEDEKILTMTRLDRLLDTLSSYAIMPAKPRSDVDLAYKQYLWHGVEKWVSIINQDLAHLKTKKLNLNRRAFDKKIKQLQAVSIS